MSTLGNCNYTEVSKQISEDDGAIDAKTSKDENIIPWKLFFRQLMICGSIWMNYLSLGLCIGAPTVIIPQIRREANSTDAISQEMASWLSSGTTYSGTVIVVIYTFLPKYIGRKLNLLLTSALAFVGFIILYLSKTVTHLIISEIFQGVVSASQVTLNLMIISEYSSPRYRGIFLTIKSATFIWGIWISNAIGTFFHWKYIGIIGCVVACCNSVIILICPESPYWLASKNRLEECAEAHRWLKGKTGQSEIELDDLVKRQTVTEKVQSKTEVNCLQKCYIILTTRSFYKPVLISILVLTLYNSLGKMTCTVYAIDIIKNITGSESDAYKGMLLLDGVTILAIHVGCFVSRFSKRKPMFLLTSGLGIFFLYSLSIYLYIVAFYNMTVSIYFTLLLLIGFTFFVSMGPLIMCTSIIGEVFPLSYRNMFSLIVGIYMNVIFATFLKIAPFLFSTLGLSGSFFLFASLSLTCLILCYIYIPETKDKTLVEIESLIKGNEIENSQ